MNIYTEQPVNRSFLKISGPIILSLLVNQFHLVLDTIIVGRYLGVNELAAVGNAISIVAMFLIILGGLEMGCEVIVGKYMGKKHYPKVVSYIYGISIFSGVTAIILTIISIWYKYHFFSWINLDQELWDLASEYIVIYSMAFIFIFIYDISKAFLISIGDAKTPFVIILFSSSLNLVLIFIFINTFNMGISGVAFATLISQMVGMFITLGIVFRRLKNLPAANLQFSFKQFHLYETISVSFPMIIQQGVVTVSVLIHK